MHPHTHKYAASLTGGEALMAASGRPGGAMEALGSAREPAGRPCACPAPLGAPYAGFAAGPQNAFPQAASTTLGNYQYDEK